MLPNSNQFILIRENESFSDVSKKKEIYKMITKETQKI